MATAPSRSPDIAAQHPPYPDWLEAARNAPSAHNTQPWRFVLPASGEPAGRIEVRWNPDRLLLAGDPTDRDLYLALGAAVESACLRARANDAPLRFMPAPDRESGVAGYLEPDDGPPDSEDLRLARQLERRHTARVAHLPTPIAKEVTTRLQDEAARRGCRLYIVEDKGRIQRLAALARRATAAQFADAAVQRELWRWLRLDPARPDYRRDGLTADCLTLRGAALAVARAAMPPARMRLLSLLRLHHLLALDAEVTMRRSAAVLLLTVPMPSPRRRDLVAAGRLLQRLWLIAAEADLTTHPFSALLDCAATAMPAATVCGATGATDETPVALYRMGATPPVPRAPRLPLVELLERAGRPQRVGHGV